MRKTKCFARRFRVIRVFRGSFIALVVAPLLCAFRVSAVQSAAGQESPAAKQRELIQVLTSDAAPADKALVCKKLAVYGTSKAVPALAALLSDEQLASWARIALEAIPGSAADAALRKAMRELHGKLLVGVINSIGVRRDSRAVNGLIKDLSDNDAEVASAAAVALGRIGNDKAASALEAALATAPAGVRSAAAQGCVLCAEKFASLGKSEKAVKLYAAVRSADVPKQRILEATRGMILARKSAGLALLLEQLRSPDRAFFRLGLRVVREVPGLEVTKALAAELKSCPPERQAPLLLAVADRPDGIASAVILEAAKTGPANLRVVAIGALERQGDVSSVPVLLEAAVDPDAAVAQAGLGALTRLPGNDVNANLLARLPQATGKARRVLLELAGRRRIDEALPTIVASAQDPDASVRRAAIQAIAALGDEPQMTVLVGLLQKTESAGERTDLQSALSTIGGRVGAQCVPDLLPLMQSADSGLRLLTLPVLAAVGGPEALNAVKAAVEDKDEPVRDEAVRTLSTWPNNWPEDSSVLEPLLALAKDPTRTTYQVLAARGYLHFLEGDKQLKEADKLGKVRELMPMLQRPEEQQLAVTVIGGVPTEQALELLCDFCVQPAAAEDACAAIVKLTGEKSAGISKEQRRHALELVLEKAKEEKTRKKAETRLKAL